jgi:S1-C subfamily serine protease
MLLGAGVLALVCLWLLARFRFQDEPVTPNPIPAVLTQLRNPPRYEDLAGEVARVQGRLGGIVVPLAVRPGHDAGAVAPRVAALALGDETGLALLPHRTAVDDGARLATDPATGLTVVRLPAEVSETAPIWVPRRLDQPRYLIASELSEGGLSFRPAFVPSLTPTTTPLWRDSLWTLSASTALPAGTLLFTGDAELVGLVLEYGGRRLVVPGATLVAEAARLREQPAASPGSIGVEVQALTGALGAATGARQGVIVSWVDPDGPAAGRVRVGDVIEALDGLAASRETWDVRMARLAEGETLVAQVRRQDEAFAAPLVAAAETLAPASRVLGLTLRARAGSGSEVVRVDQASAADRAGVAPGDLITLAGGVHAPSPAQVARAFASAPDGHPVMIAITRGDAHFLTTLER